MDFVSPRGRYFICYLDDFLTFASLFTVEGGLFLDTVLGILADLQVPVALNELEGPGTMVGLGILIDTARRGLRLPLDKLARLRRSIASWLGGRYGCCLELESLHGVSPTWQLWLNRTEFSCGNCLPWWPWPQGGTIWWIWIW